MNQKSKSPKFSIVTIIVIALLLSAITLLFSNPTAKSDQITLSKFIEEARSGRIESIEVKGTQINLALIDGSKQFTYKESGTSIYDILEKGGVPERSISTLPITVTNNEGSFFWQQILISLVPFLLIILFFVFMMRSAQSNQNSAMSFGKSKARLHDGTKEKTSFDDVAGADEAKEELMEVVDFLKNPGKYQKMGAKIPKGVLLVGSPGTGKTLLARAVAGEADAPFFSLSGSEFVEMFVGVGAARVRDLFEKAKKSAPSIIFIDEIDAVGRHRGAGMGGGHDEREQTLNQILTEMDGFETGTNVIIFAATNRPDILDPALLRPGRFDRKVMVDMPDVKAREEILIVHTRKKPMASKIDLHRIAQVTAGFTGADLENLANEAAIAAAKDNHTKITMDDLEEAIDKVAMGRAKRSRVMSEKEKKITAYHEVGHAIVGHLLPNCDSVHKVTVIPRGMALGVTHFLPGEDDRYLMSKSKIEDTLCAMLGGYTAEQIFFNELTTGASNDLQKVKSLATSMVTKYGMSDLGPIIFGDSKDEVFLGKDFGHIKNYSEESAARIDQLVKDIIDNAYKRTKELISKHKKVIEKISEDLLVKETISGEELAKYFKIIPAPKKSEV
ncbi:cell division protein FtsH [Candidatus Peregrinibacteria bacterium HGW-Peregrinibacteria-1]|jgi:cell division protease FtsH|nr:MAG: cell division protein FtsH [Candidatus Peregrinibacteria bacterium HGW-Peregrinibacteria-1]